jgi:hypothetical protein
MKTTLAPRTNVSVTLKSGGVLTGYLENYKPCFTGGGFRHTYPDAPWEPFNRMFSFRSDDTEWSIDLCEIESITLMP